MPSRQVASRYFVATFTRRFSGTHPLVLFLDVSQARFAAIDTVEGELRTPEVPSVETPSAAKITHSIP